MERGDGLDRLLAWIVQHEVIDDGQKDVDLNAAASDDDLMDAKSEVAARERERAVTLRDPFRRGLVLAAAARDRGEPAIDLDDRDPDENAVADAMTQLLVPYNLAESRSRETEPMHYVYSVSVNWDALGAVAASAGVDLGRAVADVAR